MESSLKFSNLIVDFNKSTGKVKPMHGVNNGPLKQSKENMNQSNFTAFKEAGIPFARTHDSSHCHAYGGNHTIDVAFIFTDFSKDPYDENNYDFTCTDSFVSTIINAGAEVFYRLGTSIEHYEKKYNCIPPQDFNKYAIVCEHIIRHYNEGWANGFYYNIKWWEIWNEPDTHTDGLAHPEDPSWTGTPEQFYEFFNVLHTHLKTCFPNLMIGGPALSFPKDQWMDKFLLNIETKQLDFLSWHRYFSNPYKTLEYSTIVREKLDKYGYTDTLSILDEWNYIYGWAGKDFIYSINSIKGIKGASFVQATMSLCQYIPVDILMYYDARPSSFNGMFKTDTPTVKLKGYYPFYNFNKLYNLGESCFVESDDQDVFACAATNGEKGALLLTYFNNDDKSPSKNVRLKFNKSSQNKQSKVTYYLTNSRKANKVVKEEYFEGDFIEVELSMNLFDCYYIEIE